MVWKVCVFGELHNGCFCIERAANIGDEKEIVMNALIFVCSGLPESGIDVLDNGIADWKKQLKFGDFICQRNQIDFVAILSYWSWCT